MTSGEDCSNLISLACVVKAELPGLKETYSSCGILLHPGEGIILSHGSILADLCLSNKAVLSKVKAGDVISGMDLKGCSFSALLDNSWRPVNLAVTHSLTKAAETTNTNQRIKQQNILFSPLKCKFLGAFRVNDFHNAVYKIMPPESWLFANGTEEESITPTGSKNINEDSDELTKDTSFQLLSYFVLLQCCTLINLSTNNSDNLQRQSKKEILTIGAEAEIVSTPFGGLNPHVFFNSYSKGVISNISGPNGCWILTDARCIPGSEGGPLFTVNQNGVRQIAGIVTASLCWKNKEWVGLSLVCGIDSVTKALSFHIKSSLSALDWQKLETSQVFSQSENLKSHSHIKLASHSNGKKILSFLPYVVLIKVGRVWGSGFVIDTKKSLIITCSHVIKDAGPSDPPSEIICPENDGCI